jgi:hypothetical protein
MERKHAGHKVKVSLLVKKGQQKKDFFLSDTLGQHSVFDIAMKISEKNLSLEMVSNNTRISLERILKVFNDDDFFNIDEYNTFRIHQI